MTIGGGRNERGACRGEGFVAEPKDLASAFRVKAAELIRDLRVGILTSRCGKGIDEHEGRHRLIFSHQGRVLRLTEDGDARMLSRVVVARPPGRERET